MKKNHLVYLFCLGMLVWASCKNAATTETGTEEAAEMSFGAGVSDTSAAKSFTEIADMLNTTDSVKAVLRAKVSEVCQAKGCWMNIVDPATASEEAIFVQFQDYGFFMPKDLAGKEVFVEGLAYTEETSVEDLKHYAEDAGKSAEEIAAITEPVTEKKFMATGVVIAK